MSEAEETLHWQLIAMKIKHQREVRFAAPQRQWRADFVIYPVDDGPVTYRLEWPDSPLLIEIDGGAFVSGRHGRGAGIRADLEKLNKATELGYRVLRFLPENIEDGSALAQIERCLA